MHIDSVVVLYSFEYGAGQFLLNNVQCVGNETTLASCPHSGFGSHDCRRYETAGVACQPRSQPGIMRFAILNFLVVIYLEYGLLPIQLGPT